MEKINIEIDFQDPNLYVVGGSVIAVLTICMYYIYNHKCSENTELEIELTHSEENKQDFNNLNLESEIDIEAQRTSQSTQTEDIEFYNIMGSQFNNNIDKYARKMRKNLVYEYDED